MTKRPFLIHGPTGKPVHPSKICGNPMCRAPIPPEVRQQIFTGKDGKQEYHPLDMAQFIAGSTYKVLAEDIVEFHTSARDSKRGLVTAFSYATGKFGYEGKEQFCSMGCAAASGAKGGAKQPRTAARWGSSARKVDQAEPAGNAFPGEISGPVLRRIRQKLGLSQPKMATALGYSGGRVARAVIVDRFEKGARVIPPHVQLLAWQYDQHGLPKGVEHGAKIHGA